MIIRNSNIRRIIVENRYVILVIIVGIILFISLLNVVKDVIKQNSEEKLSEAQNTINTTESEKYNNQPIIGSSENKMSNKVSNNYSNEKIIKDFISYCNSYEIKNAYNLLSDECKETVFFSNMEYFKKNYVQSIFNTNKIPNIQKWLEGYVTTYRIRLSEDILSTGNIKDKTNVIEDYYTIIQTKDGELKLNINGYIARNYIKVQEREVNGINISILKKDIFKEYEQYEIKVENKTNNTIMLDSKENANSIYLIGSNDSKYSAHTYELNEIKTVIPANNSKNMTIRFNKIYSNETEMKKMVFEDIILNYEDYKANLNKKEYNNRLKITIEM